ncbi:MAG: peroxidase [Rhodospirillales bacterium 69-11]|nr:deferrochelatase/peroxidase EfeB [Rhodospirillales bacterium]OJW29558.1 MAG: peroxidase [Rhodospirillales bacterium 69-11]
MSAMCPGRRLLLRGLAASPAALIGTARAETLPDDRGIEEESTEQRQPFYGAHQAGIVTPQPAAALVASFDVLADNRTDLERMFRTLTQRIAFLTTGGTVPSVDPKLPPLDSGLMGPRVFPDNLTMTVAVGTSLFDQDRFGLADRKPRELVTMRRFPNDALDAAFCHGDLLVQICSNTAETNIHALRDLVKMMPDLIALRWKFDGFLPPHTIKTQGRDTVRNLLGFKDGTANLDVRDTALMDRNIWVQREANEPAWTAGGSYQVVRLIRMMVERWDRTPLQEQETIFGRDKMEGAPLGMAREHDAPDYAGDPEGKQIPLDAHIRLANPRTAETASSLILRRGYNYSRGLTASGQLDMGLLFVCFQSDLAAGFVTVQKRLDGEPLEEYIKPFGGGYFFALPGVPGPNHYLGESLLAA